MPEILIETTVNPTEDPELIKRAILNLFPDAEGQPNRMTGASLDRLKQRIMDQQIRDTARTQLIKGKTQNKITFRLNKQAALANKVNFTEDDTALGDIRITVRGDPNALIEELTS